MPWRLKKKLKTFVYFLQIKSSGLVYQYSEKFKGKYEKSVHEFVYYLFTISKIFVRVLIISLWLPGNPCNIKISHIL
jgi:hypothetical protein